MCVCLAVKALHLELVTDLTKEAFLAAFLRFISRHGKPISQRSKWRSSSSSLQLGSMVLVKEKNQPPLLWQLGRVVKLHPGKDGVNRVADIKTRKGIIQRAFNNICPLPISS
ncbi:jg14460 [Pararge aegeria aegeria]|uniref:Jg14460 protein n=1 Tax=Pararge aegeria aegeria TaxID=348720 RepID=A0A8S4RVY3_9NEOP|nr:jg14460 [Pararge aegeria aegeria]